MNFLKSLFPSKYYTITRKGDKVYTQTWTMWLGIEFNKEEIPHYKEE
jgi:DNA-binding PadR family transcriptional regulator